MSRSANADPLLPAPDWLAAPAIEDRVGDSRGSSWYGYQILVVDQISLMLVGLGASEHGQLGPLVVLGAATYLAGGPVVHGLHGNGAGGWASFGARVAAPAIHGFAALYFGCAGGSCSKESTTLGFIGAAVGVLVAMIIDVAAIGWTRPIANPANR